MSHRSVVILLALLFAEAAVPIACAPVPVPVAPVAVSAQSTPAIGIAESQATPAVASVDSTMVAASATAAVPSASALDSSAPAPEQSAEPDPPCIDGELMMGACICETGKTADATGHCVFVPCPRSAEGKVPFRNPTTGQCMECRSGFHPTPDGHCEP